MNMDILIKYISIGLGFLFSILLLIVGNLGYAGVRNWFSYKKIIKTLDPVVNLSKAVKIFEFNGKLSWVVRYAWPDGHCIILVGSSYGFNIQNYGADKEVPDFVDEYNAVLAAAINLRNYIDSKINIDIAS